jgi:UDP-2-acetamido-3-amino-2,3-dideoxy-glucuronate N-acetyltransferase
MDPLVDRGAPLIHPTAEVEDGAEVGAGTRVWHFAHVRSGARIGERCVLGKSVFVDSGVVIGAGCRIQNFVSIYSGVSPFEDDVFVGPSAVFTNDRCPRASGGEWDRLPTLVRMGSWIGPNATVLCGLTIGELAVVGAGAVVTADVEPHRLVVGNPAKPVGWVCRCGRGVPGGPGTACPACGEDLTL